MLSESHALAIAASGIQRQLQDIGRDRHDGTDDAFLAPCIGEHDEPCAFDSGEHGQCVQLCFSNDAARDVLTEQRRKSFHDGQETTTRVYFMATARRAVVVNEDDRLAKA
eukprot:4082931-Pyramimonas_sp.AAC.2